MGLDVLVGIRPILDVESRLLAFGVRQDGIRLIPEPVSDVVVRSGPFPNDLAPELLRSENGVE